MNPAHLPVSTIAVGVYDEPELVVSGVGGMLAKQGHRGEVVPFGAGDSARVDVLLCDPLGRPVEMEQYLSSVAAVTEAPLIVFTWSNSPSSVRRALAAGARGFVSKSVSGVQLAEAVGAVLRGETFAPPTPRPVTKGAELSTRETEVLELICRGMSNLEIAEHLYVSVNSVKTYVRQIYQKIGVTRRAQAVAWGLAHGF